MKKGKRRVSGVPDVCPIDEKKIELVRRLNDMWAAFVKGAKGCDHAVVEEFLDAKDKAHRLVSMIGVQN